MPFLPLVHLWEPCTRSIMRRIPSCI
uniref:BLTX657 n=1 Tax=Nephila pilipes TaxID=299642 RepID=A0A076L0R8_NEPPI|nr:BLTX657 [Nephila pilipes]